MGEGGGESKGWPLGLLLQCQRGWVPQTKRKRGGGVKRFAMGLTVAVSMW